MRQLKKPRRFVLLDHGRSVTVKPLLLIWMLVALTGVGAWLWPSALEAASTSPEFANATGDCVNDTSAAGTVNWTNPGNAFSNNGTNATVSVDGTTSEYIKCTNFGFTTGMIPTGSTIDGIIVTVERQSSSTNNSGSKDAAVRIVKGGTIGATDKSTATTYTTSMVAEDHGGASDLWGETWSVSDITASNFGAAFSAVKGSSGGGRSHSIRRLHFYYGALHRTASFY